MADADDSPLTDLSELSEAESLSTDEEIESGRARGTLDAWVKQAASPPAKRKRPASPPHEYVPEDNPAIAVIVMFRSRFTDVFPKSLPSYGPQDIERGTSGVEPEEGIERLLAALLGLCLNRKKDVEKGHYNRALDEAITVFQRQWPVEWREQNPLAGGTTFKTMSPEQRLSMLLALVHWSLGSSELVRQVIAESYKGSRDMQDKGQPMAVQPWGSDGDKRRYWLIEGLDDTFFRVYRENDPKLKNRTWWSVAKDIDTAKALSEKLREDGSFAAKQLANGITQAVPRWEAGEEKRRRREYRQMRKAQFTRPEPGFSLYEGRTRGKRTRYNFSDNEDDDSEEPSGKRSRQSGISTPAEHDGPVTTLSGRRVRARGGGIYGESLLSGQRASSDQGTSEPEDNRFRTRSGRAAGPTRASRNEDFSGMDDADEDDSDAPSIEWDSDQNDEDVDDNLADAEDDEDEEMSDGGLDEDDQEIVQPSKVVTIKLGEATTARLAASRRAPDQRVEQSDGNVAGQYNGIKEEVKSLPQRPAATPMKPASIDVVAKQIEIESRINGIATPHDPTSSVPNGTHIDMSVSALLDTPPNSQAKALKMEEHGMNQTPTPPLSDIQHSAPGT